MSADRRPLPVEVLAAGEDDLGAHATGGTGRSVRTARIRHVTREPACVSPTADDLAHLPTLDECGARLPEVARPEAPRVPAAADQPPPRPSTEPPLWPEVIARAHAEGLSPEVIADMRERDQFGRSKYGTALRTGNGRDFAVDLYQELLDACPYAAGAFGVDDPEVAAAMAAVVRIRARLAPCGACHSLRAIGSAVCSRCGATC